jgi:hypothetical protein
MIALTLSSDADDCLAFNAKSESEFQWHILFLRRHFQAVKSASARDRGNRKLDALYFQLKDKIKQVMKLAKDQHWQFPVNNSGRAVADFEEEINLRQMYHNEAFTKKTNIAIWKLERAESLAKLHKDRMRRKYSAANTILDDLIGHCIHWRKFVIRSVVHLFTDFGKQNLTRKYFDRKAIMWSGCGQEGFDRMVREIEDQPARIESVEH